MPFVYPPFALLVFPSISTSLLSRAASPTTWLLCFLSPTAQVDSLVVL